MNILQLIDSLNVGGAEVLAVNIANELSKSNSISHLCVSRKEGELKENISEEVNYFFLNRKSTLDFSSFLRLRKYCKFNKINVIHAHTTSYFLAVIIKVLLFGNVKVIWHNHTGAYMNLKGFKLYFIKWNSLFFDVIINVNQELNQWSKQNFWCKKNYQLNNFPYFSNNSKTTFLKGVEGKRIVHLAGLREVKNHFYFFEAFKELLKTHSDYTLHLVGKDYQDEYSNKIKKYITQEKLENSIFVYDARSDVEHILSQCSLGILSSNSEGLPLALLEYGLAKLPVLTTNVGECGKILKNPELLVELNNLNDFKDKLLNIVNSKSIRERVSVQLYENIIENYSKESFITRLQNIYKNC